MRPFFSVVLPHFNTVSNQLARSVESVVSQSGYGFGIELISVDDGSDVEPAKQADEILSHLETREGFVLRRVTHFTNLGLAAARNSGMSIATGKYVVFLDSDDWLLPGCLNGLKTHLDTQPAELTYTLTARVNDPSNKAPVHPVETDLAIVAAFNDLGVETATPQRVPELALALSSWSQVYDRKFLERNSIKYDNLLRRWEDRPFIVRTHMTARSVALYPHLVRAYFVGGNDKKLNSITRRKFDTIDLTLMYRHLRAVQESLSQDKEMANSAYASQHFWLSVQRYFSVMGGAVLPIYFSKSNARNLCLGTGVWLWQQRPLASKCNNQLVDPLPGLPSSRIPASMRGWLFKLLKHADTAVGASALFAIFALVALFRRLRAKLR